MSERPAALTEVLRLSYEADELADRAFEAQHPEEAFALTPVHRGEWAREEER